MANGALALRDSSVNGQRHLCLRPGLPSLAESAAVEADAKAKAAVAKARVADAEAVEASAKARAAYAEASAKVRVAKAQSLKADLSIFKLRRELDVVGEFGVKKYLSARLSHCFLT